MLGLAPTFQDKHWVTPPVTNRAAKCFAAYVERNTGSENKGPRRQSHQLRLLHKAVPRHHWEHVWLQPVKQEKRSHLRKKLQLFLATAFKSDCSIAKQAPGEGDKLVWPTGTLQEMPRYRQAPSLHQALTHCSDFVQRHLKGHSDTRYSWSAPQWPALAVPNLSCWHLKNSGLLTFSC